MVNQEGPKGDSFENASFEANSLNPDPDLNSQEQDIAERGIRAGFRAFRDHRAKVYEEINGREKPVPPEGVGFVRRMWHRAANIAKHEIEVVVRVPESDVPEETVREVASGAWDLAESVIVEVAKSMIRREPRQTPQEDDDDW